jgi:hypothetical protein
MGSLKVKKLVRSERERLGMGRKVGLMKHWWL